MSRLVSPHLEMSGSEMEAAFDTWFADRYVYVMAVEALRSMGAGSLVDYLEGLSLDNVQEQAVMLLFAFGTNEGATLTYDETSIMVKHEDGVEFGVINGVVKSRFHSGEKLDVLPAKVIGVEREVRCFNKHFIALYREAYRVKDEGAALALLVLRTGDPKFDFKWLAEVASRRRPINERFISKICTIARKERDPVASLYRVLVPRYMSPTRFTKTIGRLGERKHEPTEAQRIRYVQRLQGHFYNNKREE